MTAKTLTATEIRTIVRDQVAKSLETKASAKAIKDLIGGAVSEAVTEAVGALDLEPAVSEKVQSAVDAIDFRKLVSEPVAEAVPISVASVLDEKEPDGVKVGSSVEFRQNDEWLAMIVTHVFDDDVVSGVAMSGIPTRVGWHRGAMEFHNVQRGDDNRNWRPRK